MAGEYDYLGNRKPSGCEIDVLLNRRSEYAQPGARSADPADGQVCGKTAMFLGKAKGFQFAIQGRMQFSQGFAAMARAEPQRLGPTGAWKRACGANLQFKRLERYGRFLHGVTYLGNQAQGHFVEKFQRQVQVMWLDPRDLAPCRRKDPDQLRRSLPYGSERRS